MSGILNSTEMAKVKRNISDIDKTLNQRGTVKPLWGNEFYTLPEAVQRVIETGGFEPFETEVELLASTPLLAKKAAKALDTKKIWLYVNGAWKDTGLSELDQAKEFAQAKSAIAQNGANLNSFTDDSIVHIPISGYAGTLLNKPAGLENGAVMIVKNTNGDVAHQTIIGRNGIFSRWGVLSGTWVFNEWSGIKFNNQNILDVDQVAAEKAQNQFAIAEQAFEKKGSLDFNSNINNLTASGVYHIPSTGVMSSIIGKPSQAVNGGILFVRTSINYGTNHQVLITPQGLFSRYTYAGSWLEWVFTPNMEVVNNAISEAISTIQPNIVKSAVAGFGSSTLWYLGNELQNMSEKYGRKYYNCGVSGETVQGAMLSQGSLKMKGSFRDNVLSATGASRFFAEFDGLEPTHMHHRLTLDNGVLAQFTRAGAGEYDVTPVNNTVDINTTGVVFNVYNHIFNNLEESIHIINVGKNNINTNATAEEIYNMTVEMVEYIKTPRRFVVAGHFSNTGESETHIAKVELLNRLLWAKYNKYYVDLNEILFSDATWTTLGLTKTQADIDAIARRTLPPSLSRDGAHLSEGMDQVFANAIESKLLELKYL